MTQKDNTKVAGRVHKDSNSSLPKSSLRLTKFDSMKTSMQGQKITGVNSLTSNKKLPLSSIQPPPLQLNSVQSTPKDSHILQGQFEQLHPKIKLQLFPIDKVTRKGLEQEGYNPHLELNLKPEKKISSVVEHLNLKWGNSKLASGELMLFNFSACSDNKTDSSRWTLKDTETSAADVYESLGRPAKFRLSYGWVSPSENKAGKRIIDSIKSVDDVKLSGNFIIDSNDNREQLPDSSQQDLPAPFANSFCQGFVASSSLDKSVSLKVNHNTENKGKFLLNNSLSNISFGAILSELSQTPSNICCPVSTDSFDAALAALVSRRQPQPIDESLQASRFSILEAEETRHPFSFTKITSAHENASSMKDCLHIDNAEKLQFGPPAAAVSAYSAYQDLSSYAELQRKNNDAIEQVASIQSDSKGF